MGHPARLAVGDEGTWGRGLGGLLATKISGRGALCSVYGDGHNGPCGGWNGKSYLSHVPAKGRRPSASGTPNPMSDSRGYAAASSGAPFLVKMSSPSAAPTTTVSPS
jgi:hypothetical protein